MKFRFAIRDILWLTVVVGLAIVLWRNNVRLFSVTREREAWKRSSEHHTKLYFDAKRLIESQGYRIGQDLNKEPLVLFYDDERIVSVHELPPRFPTAQDLADPFSTPVESVKQKSKPHKRDTRSHGVEELGVPDPEALP